MTRAPAPVLLLLVAVLLGGCAAAPAGGPTHRVVPRAEGVCRSADECADPRRNPATGPSARGDAGLARASTVQARPRRFWVRDRRHYRSPWYDGAHRRMINFGCTRAPYYTADPRCTRRRGFHHGLDIAMPCGTRLFSALRGRVVNPSSRGALGPAYGRNAFRIRNHRFRVDLVFGHTRRVYVRPGQRVHRGQRIARASDMGAPDGCHLHFEVRPRRGSYEDAVNPRRRLQLRAVD